MKQANYTWVLRNTTTGEVKTGENATLRGAILTVRKRLTTSTERAVIGYFRGSKVVRFEVYDNQTDVNVCYDRDGKE